MRQRRIVTLLRSHTSQLRGDHGRFLSSTIRRTNEEALIRPPHNSSKGSSVRSQQVIRAELCGRRSWPSDERHGTGSGWGTIEPGRRCRLPAGMVKLVNTVDLKSTGLTSLPVRVRFPAPNLDGTACCQVCARGRPGKAAPANILRRHPESQIREW